jgi:hypothetical protein
MRKSYSRIKRTSDEERKERVTDPFPFDNPSAFFHLNAYGKVYALRSQNNLEGVYPRVSYDHNTKLTSYALNVKFIEPIEITREQSSYHCDPFNALDKYVKKSGFSTVNNWCKALEEWHKIPIKPQTRTFYLYLCTKL